MPFMNASEPIGVAIIGATNNITGSLMITLVLYIMLFIAICLLFKLPIELTIPAVFPLLLSVGSYYSAIMPVLGAAIFYLAILFSKWFFIQ